MVTEATYQQIQATKASCADFFFVVTLDVDFIFCVRICIYDSGSVAFRPLTRGAAVAARALSNCEFFCSQSQRAAVRWTLKVC